MKKNIEPPSPPPSKRIWKLAKREDMIPTF